MAFGKLPLSFFSMLRHELGAIELGAHWLATTDPIQPLFARGEELILLDQAQNILTHRDPTHECPPPELLVQFGRKVLDLEVSHSMTLAC